MTGQVLLAAPRGCCAGVDRAVSTVEKVLELYGAPVYVRGEIVHNRFVVESLKRRGAVFVAEITEVPEGAVVIFSAHGVAPAVREEAARRGLHAIDATLVQGQVIKTVPESQIVETLIEEATKLAEAAEASSPAT